MFMKLTPGVTIASGFDIGHGPDISSCVGSTIWNSLNPFRGLKKKADIIGAGNSFLNSVFNQGNTHFYRVSVNDSLQIVLTI
jgi:hypothetical protein